MRSTLIRVGGILAVPPRDRDALARPVDPTRAAMA
jgi:hypothetical protein